MKLLTAEQFRMADAYTMQHEPISSVNLMERAATRCYEQITNITNHTVYVFAGTGNNGGDGLAIARMLLKSGRDVRIFICGRENAMSADCKTNYLRLKKLAPVNFITSEKNIPEITSDATVIDAMFGTGLNKPLSGIAACVAQKINDETCTVVSIDIPSGLFADEHTPASSITVKADYTLTFQRLKRCMLFDENALRTGRVTVLNIGLNETYMDSLTSTFTLTDDATVKKILLPRMKFSHKGTYGHALLIAGSKGKAGAAVLAARGCIRTGAGLTTAYIPDALLAVMQTSVPEAMCITDRSSDYLTTLPDLTKYTAIGAGPGLGTQKQTVSVAGELLKQTTCPLILDADALNCISMNKKLLRQLPENSILTPHPKEFERLFGKCNNDFERNEKQIEASIKFKAVIVLKGAYTSISTKDGRCYYNTSGNAGLAKGGSGDVLTGMITALRAQGYSAEDAAVAGVYLHGMAADLAVAQQSEYSITASEVADFSGKAIRMLMGR